VTITPGSPQTQRNREAARRWIAVLARKRAGTKKNCISLVAGMMTKFLVQKWEKVRGRLEPRVSTAIGWKR